MIGLLALHALTVASALVEQRHPHSPSVDENENHSPSFNTQHYDNTRHHPETATTPRIPLIGETAPAFAAQTTQGPIKFPDDFKGKWVILFSHPADFTPVCTTEFMTFATMMPEFKALNCELVGLSIDSHYSHIAWLRTIKEKIKYKDMANVEVTFPLIADVKMDVAESLWHGPARRQRHPGRARGLLHRSQGHHPRRALLPALQRPEFPEIKRLLIAMQTTDAHGCATPADWQPGDDVIVPPPGSCGTAKDRMEKPPPDSYALDWFMTFKKLPKEKLNLPPAARV